MRLPVSRCTEENITSLHDVPSPSTSPVLSKGRASEDTTNSSMLDLTDTKYRDFDVSLDSSLCLPSNRTFFIKRTLTSPPPLTQRKTSTFASPLHTMLTRTPTTLPRPS